MIQRRTATEHPVAGVRIGMRRSGKILRKAMRSIAHGHNEPPPSTIEDAEVLHALRLVLHR